MADNNGAKGDTPPVSPPVNDPDGTTTPPPGEKTGAVPFNEIIQNPEFQDFLERQIEKRSEQQVKVVLQNMGIVAPSQQKAQEPSDMDEVVREFISEHGLEETQAKKLVARIQRIARAEIKPVVTKVEDNLVRQDTRARLHELRAKDPEVAKYENKMLEVLNGMSDVEKTFVFNSPKGIEYLYDEARKQSGAPNARDRIAGGGSGGGRGTSSSQKTGDDGAALSGMAEALIKKDQDGYRKLFQTYNRR